MGSDIFGPLFLFTFLGAVIILPIYFRNKLQQKQLETVTIAIEKGIDPEKIFACLPKQERTADPNGNWKAGIILVGLGLTFGIPIAFISSVSGEGSEGLPPFLFGILMVVLGSILMRIHKTIIGAVVKAGKANDISPENSNTE